MATLRFYTQIKGVDTNFVPKIWKGLIENGLVDERMLLKYVLISVEDGRPKIVELFSSLAKVNKAVAKLHTIREDKKDLWKPGRKIHMVVFNRSKNRFQFAPVLKVKSVQKIEIDWQYREHANIFINERELPLSDEKVLQLAKNDGFDSVEHFFQWFNEDFTGKIIHWANLKY